MSSSASCPERGVDATQLADADALAHELARLMRLFERARADFATQCRDGVERAAYVLLAHLVADGPYRLSALAEAVYSDPSTVSRQVAHLVQRGLVERRPDPQDGRAARLSATEDGRRAFAEHRRIRNEHTAALLAGWPARDVHRLVGLLDRLSTNIEDYRAHLAATGEHTVQEGPRS
ncbi:MAG: MarR family winged helix-turn-helix transcriptional regulator [Pseudonocardiaceae bacterium]